MSEYAVAEEHSCVQYPIVDITHIKEIFKPFKSTLSSCNPNAVGIYMFSRVPIC